MKGEKYPGIDISRTLGDQIAKTIGVVNTPEINEIELTGNECFIIVASDGIWEFLSNDRVKDIVLPFYLKNDPQSAVNSLISIAAIEWDNDGSARDDITCIAYFFQRKEQQQQQQHNTHTYYKYNNMYYYNDTYW
jgi:serine/threonine protein phosphatase PrpC